MAMVALMVTTRTDLIAVGSRGFLRNLEGGRTICIGLDDRFAT